MRKIGAETSFLQLCGKTLDQCCRKRGFVIANRENTIRHEDAESFSIRGSIHYACIGAGFLDLDLGSGYGIGSHTIEFIFPSDNLCLGKPLAQAR